MIPHVRSMYSCRKYILNSFSRNWRPIRWLSSSVKEDDLKKIRNIGIIAHIDAGKTTTTERMLFYSGLTNTMGEVHDGDTVMDYMAQERERGITITSAAITFSWRKHKINLIDTPGHVDFTIEVERSLCALDGGIVILDSSAGVEVQTLTVWQQANRHQIPCIIYLNKMDKPSANFQMCLNSLTDKLKVKPLIVQLPIGTGNSFCGVIDLISMKKLVWDKTGVSKDGRDFINIDMDVNKDKDLLTSAIKARKELVENIADLDDQIADKFILEGPNSLTLLELTSALRRITICRTAVPVLCGSSYKNIAVQPLLDAVLLFLPNPNERPCQLAVNDGDLCALAFKIIHDKRKGALTFLRLYSGSITNGQKLYNTNREHYEKVSSLMIPLADDFNDIYSVSCGNIAVVSGLKNTVTGDTFSSKADPSCLKGKNLSSLIHVPDPVFFCTIEPPSLGLQKRLEYALECLEREDPTFRFEHDDELGQIIISGMGELHIDVIREKIRTDYGVDAYLGKLQVAYRETLTEKVRHTYILEKTLGNVKNYVKIQLEIVPSFSSEKFKEVKVIVTKENCLGKIYPNHFKALNTGVHSSLIHGPILGFSIIGIKVNLHWLEIGKGTTLPMISAAASQCIQEMLKKSQMQLLEPVMKLSISTAKGYAGRVLSDLSQKRSQILSMEVLNDIEVIVCLCPLSELMGYSTTLRALTSGNCTFTLEFDSYEKMDVTEQAKAVENVTGFAPL